MPIDPFFGALLGGATQTLGNIFNNQSNQGLAQQQGNWNRESQRIQNQFNLDQWNRTNQYNSPAAQMQRFKDAGLNPHLIYGRGQSGNAQPLKAPDIKPYSRAENKNIMGGVDVFGQYNQFRQIQAQTNNLKANTAVQNQTAILKAAQSLNETLNWKRGKFQFGLNQKYQADAMAANLSKALSEASIAGDNAAVSSATKDTKINQAKALLNNTIKTGKIQDFEIGLNDIGLTKSDPKWQRMLATYWNSLTPREKREYKDFFSIAGLTDKILKSYIPRY